jgi:hypothetical protein
VTAQWVIVGLVVGVSAICVAWTLMPASLRRVLATLSLRLALPPAIAARMRAHAAGASSCGCSGCDRNESAASDASTATTLAVRPIALHRTMPRRSPGAADAAESR